MATVPTAGWDQSPDGTCLPFVSLDWKDPQRLRLNQRGGPTSKLQEEVEIMPVGHNTAVTSAEVSAQSNKWLNWGEVMLPCGGRVVSFLPEGESNSTGCSWLPQMEELGSKSTQMEVWFSRWVWVPGEETSSYSLSVLRSLSQILTSLVPALDSMSIKMV